MCRCSAAAIARALVAFLDAFLVGCYLSCFRARPRRGSGSGSGSGGRDALVPGDRVGEVQWDDDQGLGRSGTSQEDLADDSRFDKEELRREANYLKLCGTISETPAELQLESHESSLQNTNKFYNMPTSVPATFHTSEFEANSSEGCGEHQTLKSEMNTEDTQHLSGVESAPISASVEKSPFQNIKHEFLDRSASPLPTPVVLRDDMQTPGTICTSHRGPSISGKQVRPRKQFIYPVLRPIENRLQLAEDSSPLASYNPPKRSNLEADYIKKPKQTPSTSSFSAADNNVSYQVKEAVSLDSSTSNSGGKNAASLSQWLKSSSTDGENQADVKHAVRDQSDCSLLTERPVFMASDLNWDVDNPTPRLPKTCDGNGIPNTTARYKEDQKVSWHTTPFEERLLKVLSDEEHCPPRKGVRGKLFH